MTTNLQLKIEKLTDEEFAAIQHRGLVGPWPTAWHDTCDHPLREITVYPIPTKSGLGIEFWYYDLLEFDKLPPGYARYLRLALALELCTEFGKEPSQALIANYIEAREQVNRVLGAAVRMDPTKMDKVKNAFSKSKPRWGLVEMQTDTSIPSATRREK